MTVESNYAISIAMLGDCENIRVLKFQTRRSKANPPMCIIYCLYILISFLALNSHFPPFKLFVKRAFMDGNMRFNSFLPWRFSLAIATCSHRLLIFIILQRSRALRERMSQVSAIEQGQQDSSTTSTSPPANSECSTS